MWKLSVLFFTLLINSSLSLEANSKFTCDETFCIDQHLNTPCPTKRNCTTQGTRTYLTPEKCNCCEGTFCIEYMEEGTGCETDATNPAFVDLCGPQLACDPTTRKCGPLSTTQCMKERLLYDQNFKKGTVGTAQFKPQCDAVGRYSNRQCLPGSVCFCVNTVGKRIFGVGLVTTPTNCKCARDIDNLRNTNALKGNVPRCLPNGDYDELQCVGRDCWCLFKPNDKKKLNDISNLSCFKKALHPTKPTPYLRECEYARNKIEVEHLQAKNETRVTLVPDYPKCDPDGYFSAVQSRNDKLICADHLGNQIGYYEISKNSPRANRVDCYCARVEQLMENNVNGKPVCCKHGNFRKWQCSGSLCYCVDRDGKQVITPGSNYNEVHKDDLNLLKCYQSSDDDCVY
ncbi:unnamed protein product [Allacma fusca]|uniref:Thyroglobulin type-1 domain-containing protein n=1 Tax=Allacma fusca TaxID=39272 RepID=A0A8J2KKY5_9HEXA|nr:unnamed protein product [Allacma fusca]